MQSWVELPEPGDEIWKRINRADPSKDPAKIPQPKWRSGLENLRQRKISALRKKSMVEKDNQVQNTYPNAEINKGDELLQIEQKLSENGLVSHNGDLQTDSRNRVFGLFGNVTDDLPKVYITNEITHNKCRVVAHNLDTKKESTCVNISDNNNEQTGNKDFQIQVSSTDENLNDVPIALPKDIKETKMSFGNVVRVAQRVRKFKKQPKFNYEKYFKFLELTLDTVGFSLGNVTVTWDRVSLFIVFLLTLVGMFAQNAFLK